MYRSTLAIAAAALLLACSEEPVAEAPPAESDTVQMTEAPAEPETAQISDMEAVIYADVVKLQEEADQFSDELEKKVASIVATTAPSSDSSRADELDAIALTMESKAKQLMRNAKELREAAQVLRAQ